MKSFIAISLLFICSASVAQVDTLAGEIALVPYDSLITKMVTITDTVYKCDTTFDEAGWPVKYDTTGYDLKTADYPEHPFNKKSCATISGFIVLQYGKPNLYLNNLYKPIIGYRILYFNAHLKNYY